MKTKSTIQKLKRVKNAGIRNLYIHDSGKYYMRAKIKGEPVTESLHTTDLPTAKRLLLARLDNNFQHEQPVQVEVPTLETLCARFLETKAGKSKGMIKNYQWVIGRLEREFPKFTFPIDAIRPSDLAIYFVELGMQIKEEKMGPRSFNHITQIVRMIFQLAVDDNLLDRNPVLLVPKNGRRKTIEKSQKTEPTIPTVEQFERIVENIRSQQFADTRDSSADFVSFCALASVGEAEANFVTWQDVDWKAQRIKLVRRKTGKEFYVPFFPWLKPFISDLWERSGKPATGRIFSIRSCKQSIYNACRRLELPLFSPRDFRKMGIKRQIRAGLDEKMVAKFQGHSDGGKLIYDTYTAEFDQDERERERKIIEAMRD